MRSDLTIFSMTGTGLVSSAILWSGLTPLLEMADRPVAEPAAYEMIAPDPVPEAKAAAGPVNNYRRQADGLFYVVAQVNGEPIRFLVDTGANVVVLTPGDARRAGIDADAGPAASMDTASGKTPMRWATLEKVKLAGRTVRRISAAITQQPGGVSLLGQSVLSQFDSFSIEKDRLSLR